LWLAALVLALAAAAAPHADLQVARYVKDLDGPGDLVRLVRLAEAFAYGGTVAIIVLAAALLDPRGWRVVPRLAICAFGAGLAADGAKLLVARSRPLATDLSGSANETVIAWLPMLAGERLAELDLAYGSRLQSFPSGHTATAVGLAIALAVVYPRGRWLFAALAVLAGLQRIQSQSHFTSDVLAGAAIGCVIGALCTGRSPIGRWLCAMERPPERGRESLAGNDLPIG
jgi:membrane-associated phospholipid phosphatase